MKLLEKDLKVFDVWESPNGNWFLKVDDNHSIALGSKGHHGPEYEGEKPSYVKANDIVPVKKIGKIKIKK
jgi:hypothetical protein